MTTKLTTITNTIGKLLIVAAILLVVHTIYGQKPCEKPVVTATTLTSVTSTSMPMVSATTRTALATATGTNAALATATGPSTLYDAPVLGRQCLAAYSYYVNGEPKGSPTGYYCGPSEIQSGVKGVRLHNWRRLSKSKKFAHAQQPVKPDTPKPITLSAEASERYIALENQKAALRTAYGELMKQQDSLLVGAQMPPEQRKAVEAWQPPAEPPWKTKDGVLVFPAPVEAVKTKP